MTPALPALRDFSDRLSPMVVKEMRQGLRTRTFTAALILMHVMLMCVMVALLVYSTNEQATRNFWRVLVFIFGVAVPIQGFNSLTQEMRAGTLDMLWLTGITPLRIVHGKWLVLFSQTLLMASTLLPYLIARYRLGGVEIAGEGIALAIMVGVSAVSSASIVAFSWHPQMLMRLIPALATLALSLWVADYAFSIATEEYTASQIISTLSSLSIHEWLILTASLMVVPYGFVTFCLRIGACRIDASLGHDQCRRKRWLLARLTAGQLLLFVLLVFTEPDLASELLIALMGLLLLASIDLVTEEMPTHWAALHGPGGHQPAKFYDRWFYPGWASGVHFYMALCAGVIGCLGLVCEIAIRTPITFLSSEEVFWPCCCLLEASFVSVCLSRYSKSRYVAWWYTHLGAHAIGAVLFLTSTSLGLPELSLIGFLTPITAVYATSASGQYMSWLPCISALWGGTWVIGAMALAGWEGRRYGVLETLRKQQGMASAIAGG